jgi:RNA polymerase sigma-32 factor
MKASDRAKKIENRKKSGTAAKPASIKKTLKETLRGKRPEKSAPTQPSATAKPKQLQKKAPSKTKKSGKGIETIASQKARPSEAPQPLKKSTKAQKDMKSADAGKPAGAIRTATEQPEAVPAAAEAVESRPDEDEGAEARNGKPQKPQKVDKNDKSDDSDKALVKFDPLQRYLSEISKYRLLTREEERKYGLQVREQGDKDAAYALVTANLRLVVKIALEFQRVWMQNLLDLIQEGNIGLMQAVKKFDPYKNVKFSYYASFWIKAYILKFIMDNWRLVKIGTTQGQRKLFFKLKKEKQHLIDQGFDPKPKLLSERLGVSEREIVDMDQRLDSWDVSLDAPLKNDSETERIEFLSTDNESVEEQVSKKEIELLLHNKITEFRKKMTPREIEIFELRIFSDNPVTLQEIGDRYGISRERVRQVEKNIIRKMREFFKREIPDFASYAEDTGME